MISKRIHKFNLNKFVISLTAIFSISWTSLLQSCARKEKVRSPITCHTFTTIFENLPSMLPSMPQRIFDIFCILNSVPCSVFRLVNHKWMIKYVIKILLSLYLVSFVWFKFLIFTTEINRAHPDFFIPNEYFIPVTCFLTMNLFAVFGNLCPSQRCSFVSRRKFIT